MSVQTKRLSSDDLFRRYIEHQINTVGPSRGEAAGGPALAPWLKQAQTNIWSPGQGIGVDSIGQGMADPSERARFDSTYLPSVLAGTSGQYDPGGVKQVGPDQYDVTWKDDNSLMSEWLPIVGLAAGAITGGTALTNAFSGAAGAGATSGFSWANPSTWGQGLSNGANNVTGWLDSVFTGAQPETYMGWNSGGGSGMDWDFSNLFDTWSPESGANWGGTGGTGDGMFGNLLDLEAQFPQQYGQLAGEAAANSTSMEQLLKTITDKVGPQAAKSVFSQLLSGDGKGGFLGGLGSLLGAVGPGLANAFAANQQSNALKDIADQARSDRAPFLDYAKGLLAGGPEAYGAGAGANSLKAILQKLSVQGNPLGSGTSMQLATDAGLNNWQNAVGSFGNLGLAGQGLQAQLSTNAVNAGGGVYAGLGDAASSLFTEKEDLASLLRKLNGFGNPGLT